ncbi:FYN-binding protein 1 isoform X2 [Ambystoma mexicanum]|uniref:FYN-binding protein 1 isoform X2 n=1 Tax=Ambystoma mexicanum TaxID=8296 RepID=UPI0037E8A241
MGDTSNVKTLMAKFTTGNTTTEDVSGPNRAFNKIAGQHATKGNSSITARQAALAQLTNASSNSGSTSFQKPPKPPFGTKSILEEGPERDAKPAYVKPNTVLNRLSGSVQTPNKEAEGQVGFAKPYLKPTEPKREETKPPFLKSPPQKPFQGSSTQGNDNKPVSTKPSFLTAQHGGPSKPTFTTPSAARAMFSGVQEEDELKPSFPKKQPLGQKPSLNINTPQNGGNSTTNSFLPKPLKDTFPRQTKDPLESTNDSEHQTHSFPGVTLRPTTAARSVQSPFLTPKADEGSEDKRARFGNTNFQKKYPEDNASSAATVNRFPKLASKFPPELTSSSQEKKQEEKGTDAPKRKALPPLFKLGGAPKKPSRPPHVDLDKFHKRTTGDSSGKGAFNKANTSSCSANDAFPPPPPPTHPTTQAAPPLPPTPLVPSLPPRNIRSAAEPGPQDLDESFNEGSSFHSTADGSDEEIYEGIDDNSPASTKEDEKRREKEEKKRQEQEKKEQREKEKKEQDMRKRFKLVGPIEVLHQVKACIDCKGGKNELSFKLGDALEVIRLSDNPEGKWLARIKDNYGYVKITSVQIDYNTLKRKDKLRSSGLPLATCNDQEVYDDVAEQESMSRHLPGNSSGSMFPPPPCDDDIYDGIDDGPSSSSVPQEEEKSWTWTLLKKIKGKDDKGKSANDNESGDNEGFVILSPPPQFHQRDSGEGEVYDDVESHDFPPTPKELSSGMNTKNLTLGRTDDKDVKKLKKMEKEEKEFRKKFKYDGEIHIIRAVKITSCLNSKKLGTKDLPVKPGETVEIIQNTDDIKVLCRNDEGKYGYVMRSNIDSSNDGEIYDDIGDDCIYDN